jgi:hypothetical protein
MMNSEGCKRKRKSSNRVPSPDLSKGTVESHEKFVRLSGAPEDFRLKHLPSNNQKDYCRAKLFGVIPSFILRNRRRRGLSQQ